MNPNSILNWFFYHMLEQQFSNDRREMALQLRVSERTLEGAMDDEKPAEIALLFEQLLGYSVEHDICVDDILAEYKRVQR